MNADWESNADLHTGNEFLSPGRKSCQDPGRILYDAAGSYRILCRILRNPVGPFEDFL